MLSYGPRLDERTYYDAVRALYFDELGTPSKISELQRRLEELNLTIDHKLGVDFPAERREVIWAAQRRIDRKLLPLVIWGYIKRAFSADYAVEDPLMRSATRELATVLSTEELVALLNLSPEDLEDLPRKLSRRG